MATDIDLTARLATLQAEFDKGNAQLMQVERQAIALRETLLRITGAMQILTELSAPAKG